MESTGLSGMGMCAARLRDALLVLNGESAVFKVRTSERATLITEFPDHCYR